MLNLLGTGSPERVLKSLGGCVIEEHTLREVRRNPFDNEPAEPIVKRLVAAGLIKIARMGPEAYEKYLELVADQPGESLGSGESAALALAESIRGLVVLDDSKGRRIGEAKCSCAQITTGELFRRAALAGNIPNEELRLLVQSAIRKARMHLRKDDRGWLKAIGLAI